MKDKSILKRRNAWLNFKNKARDSVDVKIIECLEELQHEIDDIREFLKEGGDDGK